MTNSLTRVDGAGMETWSYGDMETFEVRGRGGIVHRVLVEGTASLALVGQDLRVV